LSILVWGALGAFVALILFYFLSEAIVVIVDIALNVRRLVQQSEATGE
jgi:hypothetical protein